MNPQSDFHESDFQDDCRRVSAGRDLSQAEMTAAIDWLITGRARPAEIASFLLDLRAKGESVEEIAGAALAMRRHMVSIRCRHEWLVDTCGTGGVGSEIFNVSTAAAIVTAAAGAGLGPARRIAVAKHGNRSVTSKSGSADVLTVLGIDIDAPVGTIERCLDELGIGFCFAPLLHPAMRHVGPVRRQLGVGTIFNLLGPLCNPAAAPFQLLGVGRPEIRHTLAAALQKLGTRRSVVVVGAGGVGEVTISGPTEAILVTSTECREFTWHPSDFGLTGGSLDSLRIGGPAESAALVRGVLAGDRGPARTMVVLNAAAALWTAQDNSSASSPVEIPADSLAECARCAEQAIDSGAARELLERWAVLSHMR